ncbi:hypothetical protein C5167_024716 [Papaver somniferum]|uniref:F-box domain-containing protein n=1 Tax=Papaver somniferum TaxID=3469 RepID=A0A4Y7JSN5_PAPSO|nr:hypothetical protein C5167_024716 [Papaver somniferum]
MKVKPQSPDSSHTLSEVNQDDHDVCGEVKAAITNVLEVADYNNPMIVEEEEEPDKDQSNRTPPSTPDENAGMGKLEHLDILLNIIVRLPVKSILRFRCVSKAWCKLLKDPQFVREHLNHAIEMNKFSVMILSYGLQYCSDNHTDTYIVAYDPLLSTPSNHPVHINSPSRCEDWGRGVNSGRPGRPTQKLRQAG